MADNGSGSSKFTNKPDSPRFIYSFGRDVLFPETDPSQGAGSFFLSPELQADSKSVHLL